MRESDDRTEKYIYAYHKDLRRTLFIALSLDGHKITTDFIESKGMDQHIKGMSVYSDIVCMYIVEDMHYNPKYKSIHDLPLELSNLKAESDKVLDSFDAYYHDYDVKNMNTIEYSDKSISLSSD
jgi:hypothetical protein